MREQYLEVKVTTASQAELQLMLLDGALRHGKTARDAMGDEGRLAEYSLAAAKLLDLLEAIVQGLASGTHDLSHGLEDQFVFLFRQAARAHIEGRREQLDRVLQLLAYHRETWRLATEGMKSRESLASVEETTALGASGDSATETAPKNAFNRRPVIGGYGLGTAAPASGMSLQA